MLEQQPAALQGTGRIRHVAYEGFRRDVHLAGKRAELIQLSKPLVLPQLQDMFKAPLGCKRYLPEIIGG
jgi:hypothetical protein